jgi:hypothetical protein
MRSPKLKAAVSRIALLVLSTLAGLGLGELLLRTFSARYEEAASGRYREDLFRIKSRVPNLATTRENPDTGRRHPVIYNGLAMRQHREIPPRKAEGEVRVGIFGDSFTENLGVDAPYSYTEVLDYLLNLHPRRFTVLNFGIVGYGTDQSYEYYRSSPYARDLDVVVYQFCTNDLRNLYENGLFELDSAGELARKPVPPRPLWMALASRLHLTYLFLEIRERFRKEPEDLGDDVREDPGEGVAPLGENLVRRQMRLQQRARAHDETADAIQDEWREELPSERALYYEALLRAIVERWRNDVEASGGRFCVLLPPRAEEARAEGRILGGFEVANLWNELRVHGDLSRFFFAKDGHWNELGNLFAAVHLYERLAPALGLETLPRERLEEDLYRYYRAFPDWTPPWGVRETAVDEEGLRGIRDRYAALAQGVASADR